MYRDALRGAIVSLEGEQDEGERYNEIKKRTRMNDQGEMSGPKNRIQMEWRRVRRPGGGRLGRGGQETRRSMNKRESGIEGEGDPFRQ